MTMKLDLAVLSLVAVVALAGLFVSFSSQTGASVSIVPGVPRLPHVITPSTVDRCLSNAYCPPDDVCVQGRCMDRRKAASLGVVILPAKLPAPTPNYGSYEKGGMPTHGVDSLNNDFPSYEKSDFYRHEPLTNY